MFEERPLQSQNLESLYPVRLSKNIAYIYTQCWNTVKDTTVYTKE